MRNDAGKHSAAKLSKPSRIQSKGYPCLAALTRANVSKLQKSVMISKPSKGDHIGCDSNIPAMNNQHASVIGIKPSRNNNLACIFTFDKGADENPVQVDNNIICR